MKERYFQILDQFSAKRVLVVGDLMLDRYVFGDVVRISPEAPVQVMNVEGEVYAPGGASNVASNVAALGGVAKVVGITGSDETKNILFSELKKRGIDVEGVFMDSMRPTILKTRVMARGQQLLRMDTEVKGRFGNGFEQSISVYVEQVIKDVDIVVISDYAKGVITEAVGKRVVQAANAWNKAVLVDPKPENVAVFRGGGVLVLTPNLGEAKKIIGTADEGVEVIGKKLCSDLGTNVLIKCGERGLSLFNIDGSFVSLPANVREVYSVIGAGDTVIATLALGVAAGATLKEAAVLANIAAGIKVGKKGTATVSVDEIKREMESNGKSYLFGP